MLFNEPKLLKCIGNAFRLVMASVSVLFNEPKLLKSTGRICDLPVPVRFSALQRAEIAEIAAVETRVARAPVVSVLFNEPKLLKCIRLVLLWS